MPPAFPRRRRVSVAGGRPLPLPQVSTLSASSVTATTATLNGSINPNGTDTTYWFVYGPAVPYANTQPLIAVDIGSGSVPIVVGTNLVGLVTGTTYHFALVGSSAAGTVFGADLTFTAQQPTVPVVTPSTTSPAGLAYPVVPHFAMPFTVSSQGAQVVEQDSQQDVYSCLVAITECPKGAVDEIPGFGVPDQTFVQAPPTTDTLLDAVRRLEPRASTEAIVSSNSLVQGVRSDDRTGVWQITLNAFTSADEQNLGSTGA